LEPINLFFSYERYIFRLNEQSSEGFDTTRIPLQKELLESTDRALEEYESSFNRNKRIEKLFSKFIVSDKFPEIQKLKQCLSEQ